LKAIFFPVWFQNKRVLGIKKCCNLSTVLRILLLVSFSYAATFVDEDSAAGGDMAKKLSSLNFF